MNQVNLNVMLKSGLREMSIGIVTHFNPEKGFGFLVPEGTDLEDRSKSMIFYANMYCTVYPGQDYPGLEDGTGRLPDWIKKGTQIFYLPNDRRSDRAWLWTFSGLFISAQNEIQNRTIYQVTRDNRMHGKFQGKAAQDEKVFPLPGLTFKQVCDLFPWKLEGDPLRVGYTVAGGTITVAKVTWLRKEAGKDWEILASDPRHIPAEYSSIPWRIFVRGENVFDGTIIQMIAKSEELNKNYGAEMDFRIRIGDGDWQTRSDPRPKSMQAKACTPKVVEQHKEKSGNTASVPTNQNRKYRNGKEDRPKVLTSFSELAGGSGDITSITPIPAEQAV